ncbi:[F-actin]-monooxygenase MICAL3 [Phytophthora ramorum]|uniref:[F-actin]-monooxygenase MICAL3 n=1 Tax=Phytophthora ramorum TaxID=164328 RepID=UPI0030997CFF|nr:[F-actin]-monooxygenase MICAL3 [Phytophthora ramorum]
MHVDYDQFERGSIVDCDGEGPSGIDGLDIEDRSPLRRTVLEYLATDVGEQYLDDIYKDDDTDSDGQEAVTNPNEADSTRTERMMVDAVHFKERKRTDKELAWMKVRQLLIAEEEKASTHKKPQSRYVNSSPRREQGKDCNTVKLLDSLAPQPPSQEACYVDQVPAKQSRAQRTSQRKTSAPESSFASHVDRVGAKIGNFWQRSQGSDEMSNHSTKSSQSSSSYSEPSRSAVLVALDQMSKTCRRMELSEVAISRISAHLASIDQIVRDDMNWPQKRRSRELSSTQYSNASSDFGTEFRDHPTPAALSNIQAKVAPTVRDSFKAFTAATDLRDTLCSFSNLIRDCGLNGAKVEEPWHVYYHIKAAVYSKLGYRQKHLFKLLDARFNLDVYKQRPAANKRVCIVGAGPVGLRAAIELALLGSHVSVLEKRTKFSRENMLHLWPWVVQDLAALGSKVLFPNFCKSRTYFHVSTRLLQVVLLKVALLVGVKVHSATQFDSIAAPGLESEGGNPFYYIKTEPQIPIAEFTAVLGATGTNNQLAEPAGINRFVFSNKESLGIVCYFPNLETPEESKVKEFSWTSQLKHHMLHKMREVGIDLENIVYFRGEMHYMVMTPKRKNLLHWQVVKGNCESPTDLVKRENVSESALHEFVKRIIEFVGIPKKADFTRVNLLDFSSLTRAEKAASVLTSHGKKLYVGLIGDSLLEPVWHEGVGTCRGFLSALDGVWMVAQIGRTPDEQILADRELAYRVMQRLSGRNRDEMQKNVRKYTVDPKSRYMVPFPQVI